jgi:PAS domain S-box-containing protein
MFSVLYVDDEPILLEATKLYLERDGDFSVDTSTSASEALEKISNRSYDAIISDYQMPAMDGIQFLKELRARGNTVPFIVFTGKGREEVVIEAYEAGADSYLQKGGEPKVMFLDLKRAIERAVNKQRIENELKFRNIILATQQEVSLDGILVVSEKGTILSFNTRFGSMWGVPCDNLATKSDSEAMATIIDKVDDPILFANRVQYLYGHRDETSQDEIRLKDGRTFDRYSAPMLSAGGEYYGRIWYFRDITEKKRADEALKESAEEYRTLIESANEAIFIIQDGIIVFSNPSGFLLIDMPADQIFLHNFLEFVHPDDRQEALNRHAKRLKGEEPEPKWQFRIVNTAGVVHWIELDAVRILWNKKPATLNFATNITERKAAVQALSENEAKYREIFNSANDAIEVQELLATGLPGKYSEVNDVACRMLQYTRDELLGKSPLDIAGLYNSIPSEDLGKSLVSDGHALFMTEQRRKDGVIVPVEINAHVINISGKKMVLSVVRDITERIKQEQAIRESEERFRFTVDATNDGIWDWDIPTGTAFFSPRWFTMLGYSPDEMPASFATWRSLIHPDDLNKSEKIIQDTISNKGDTYAIEFRMRTKQGDWEWILSRGKVVGQDDRGNPVRMVGTHTDITARIQAGKALQQSLNEKELLLREIHHRVKNNLQTISSLLYLQSQSTENEQQLAVIREARARVTSMGLIHQKLYQSADIATIPFMDYIRSLIDFLGESYGIDRNRIRIEVDVQPPDLSLDIDTGIPSGLLINEIVSNALKYAFLGRSGGTISIRMVRDTLQQYTLSVSDDGVGIPADFDPLASRTLGMKLISGLVDQLDGVLQVKRCPGTTFTIRFPPVNPVPGMPVAADSQESATEETRGILTEEAMHEKENT